MSIEYLSVEDLVMVAEVLGIRDVRDYGLLHSACSRPGGFAFGVELYPTLAEKATALTESIVRNHPLIDGNKRLGWSALFLFLRMNNVRLTVAHDDGYDFIVGIASGQKEFADIAQWIQERI